MADPVATAKADVTATVKKDVSFFESNPRATAIGSAVAGAILALLAAHFLHLPV
jgi:hypothetical protein